MEAVEINAESHYISKVRMDKHRRSEPDPPQTCPLYRQPASGTSSRRADAFSGILGSKKIPAASRRAGLPHHDPMCRVCRESICWYLLAYHGRLHLVAAAAISGGLPGAHAMAAADRERPLPRRLFSAGEARDLRASPTRSLRIAFQPRQAPVLTRGRGLVSFQGGAQLPQAAAFQRRSARVGSLARGLSLGETAALPAQCRRHCTARVGKNAPIRTARSERANFRVTLPPRALLVEF